jgi:hypothetical protein
MKIEPWSDLDRLPELVSTTRARTEFMTAHGCAVALYCCSCGREIGFVSTGTPAAQLCGLCTKGDGLPLPQAPNVAIRCSGCGLATASIPRDVLGKLAYYCEPCERRMGEHPPLEMISAAAEQTLGIKRSA